MRLDNGRVRIFIADIRPLLKEELRNRVYGLLDEIRQKKADACRLPEAKAASLAAGFLAKYALEELGYSGYRVVYTDSGQPVAVSAQEQESASLCSGTGHGGECAGRLYLSLSHSGDYAVCAVSHSPVGVDIQKKQPIRTGMLRHFFSETEEAQFLVRYGIQKDERFLPVDAATEFFRCWTAKESYVKLDGKGMSLGFPNFSVDLEEGQIRGIREQEGFVRLAEYPAPEGYFLSVCLKTERKKL